MELYACGFNAWRQLEFGEGEGEEQLEKELEQELEQEPCDLYRFQCVLGDRVVGVVGVGFSWCAGKGVVSLF